MNKGNVKSGKQPQRATRAKIRILSDTLSEDIITDKDGVFRYYDVLSCNAYYGFIITDGEARQLAPIKVANGLPNLSNYSGLYDEYRVQTATLVFIPSCGTNISGEVLVRSRPKSGMARELSVAVCDNRFPLAKLRETRIPLNISTVFKPCAPNLIESLDVEGHPTLVIRRSLDEAIFSSISFKVTGAPPNRSVGTLRLEYSPEVRYPVYG
jgi:hypothetical protein